MIYDSKALYSYILFLFIFLFGIYVSIENKKAIGNSIVRTRTVNGGRTIKTQWYFCNKLSSVNDGFFSASREKSYCMDGWIIDILAITIQALNNEA